MPAPAQDVRIFTKSNSGFEPQAIWIEISAGAPASVGLVTQVVSEEIYFALADADTAAPVEYVPPVLSGAAHWVGPDPSGNRVYRFFTGPHGWIDLAGGLCHHPADDMFFAVPLHCATHAICGILVDLWGHRNGSSLVSFLPHLP